MNTDDLPQYDDEDYLGDKGVRMVDLLISEDLRWIFRDVRKADLGIDAQIELVNPEKRGTGRIIAAQIKCGESFFSESTDVGFVFRGNSKHLKYWIEHSLPVLVIICDPKSNKCYWQEVSGANTEPLEKGWKLVIPRTHVLGSESKQALSQIAGRPQHGDIVQALLYGFLHEKFTRKIEICTTFELPRDYYKYAYLAKIQAEMVMIDVHHDQYGAVRVDDLAAIVQWKEYNTKQCGATKLHIYISSESKKALQLSSDVMQYVASQREVSVFRVLYVRSPLLGLEELDETGNVIQFWPE
jgi:hypothetical protein